MSVLDENTAQPGDFDAAQLAFLDKLAALPAHVHGHDRVLVALMQERDLRRLRQYWAGRDAQTVMQLKYTALRLAAYYADEDSFKTLLGEDMTPTERQVLGEKVDRLNSWGALLEAAAIGGSVNILQLLETFEIPPSEQWIHYAGLAVRHSNEAVFDYAYGKMEAAQQDEHLPRYLKLAVRKGHAGMIENVQQKMASLEKPTN